MTTQASADTDLPPRAGRHRTSGASSLTPLVAVATGQAIVSGTFIALFSWYYSYGRRFPLFHTLEIVALMLAVSAAVGASVRAGYLRSPRSRRVVSAAIGFASALLLVLYFGDWITHRLWGGNVNYEIIQDYWRWLAGVHRQSLRISPAAYAVIVILLVSLPLLFAWHALRLFDGIDALCCADRAASMSRRRRVAVAGAVIALVFLAGGLAALTAFMRDAGLLSRDPVIGFFRSQGAAGQFGWYLSFEEQRARVADQREAYRALRQSASRNIIIIIVDALRADHMQIYGYARPTTPFLSRLEQEGHLQKVRYAFSGCSQSPCGILGTMSGKNVRQIQYDFKVFDLLHDLGYSTYFILGGRHRWEGLRQAYGDEQTLYFDGSNAQRASWDDDRMIEEGFDRVPRNVSDKAFFYVHLMSAHLSGDKWPEYQRFQPSDLQLDMPALLTGAYDREKSINRYDNGVLQADAVMERVFQRLRDLGYLANSTVFILADHGEELGERGPTSFGHGSDLHAESIRIPLLVYDESDPPLRAVDFATQFDVAPTITDRLGLRAPADWTGRSLLQPPIDRCAIIGNQNQCGAVLQRRGQAIYQLLQCGDEAELFEFTNDPQGMRNVIHEADPALLRELEMLALSPTG